jgi:transposase
VSEKLVVAWWYWRGGWWSNMLATMARPATPFRLLPDQQSELRVRLGQGTAGPRLRVRLHCVQLRDQGWRVPEIAERLAVNQATVRRALRRVRTGGLDALADRPRSGRPRRLSDQDLGAVEELLCQAASGGQVWTMTQLAGWLAGCRRVRISPGRLRALLRARGWCWARATPERG